MEELLTTRQVQDLLKVDRITIYRMLQDGRLKGVKIGQQWRFPRSEVERLLGRPTPEPASQAMDLAASFPTHCVQTIQDLYAEVSGLSAVVLDPEGNPLTEISHPCAFCRLLWQNPQARLDCQASWKQMVREVAPRGGVATCHAGLDYLLTPIQDEGQVVAWFVCGPCWWQTQPANTDALWEHLAQRYSLSLEQVRNAAREVRVIDPAQRQRVAAWPLAAARAVQSILHERLSFIERLQQIASLTQIS
ncbi:MAG: PocR ligand-binding domain-containing protein [Thermanaerothrix sp.]|jgi:excisionase family DNA binding protein|uniref:PocR ligand-binding domain-containing protein n=2 Tax=Thermanaerothrix TaxID=1077886 RepID=A0ABU3NM41_9CHLR|nr:PocR ligand-binding domain-containing protein [Thermanaerothrix sp. 4228-RoL]MDT8897894.1 PocR ligand-binding domain-containing protein [Thermanaerothrix sp. 4228-RoL]